MIHHIIPPYEAHADISDEDFPKQFVAILVLFYASGPGIFSTLAKGMTGNPSILLATTMPDLFTVAIFAKALGYSVAILCLHQFVIPIGLALGATFLMPLTTPTLIASFPHAAA